MVEDSCRTRRTCILLDLLSTRHWGGYTASLVCCSTHPGFLGADGCCLTSAIAIGRPASLGGAMQSDRRPFRISLCGAARLWAFLWAGLLQVDTFTAERFSPQQKLRLLEGGWGCFHVSNGGLRLADFWGAMAALGGCTASLACFCMHMTFQGGGAGRPDICKTSLTASLGGAMMVVRGG
jgi:hypothetical protein